jgi:tetratricopeptide (TPR) repeat protein
MLRLPPRILLLLMLLPGMLLIPAAHSFARSNSVTDGPNPFVFIKTTPADKRVEAARKIYQANCLKMTEAAAMQNLDELDDIARQIADLPLQCAVLDMRADYYAAKRKYNTTSDSYYDKAIRFAEEHDLPLEAAIYQHRFAVYLGKYEQNIPACRNFLFSQEKFREIGFGKVPGIAFYFDQVANFYYAIGDYDTARENLMLALKYQQPQSHQRIDVLNTIGLTYRNTGHFATAMQYFQKALAMASAARDSAWIGIATGNIGSVYFMQRQYAKALPLVQTDYVVSLKYEQKLNAAIALLRLVRINIDRDNLALATQQLNTADGLLLSAGDDELRYRADYFELKALLNNKLGNKAIGVQYRQKYVLAKDSLEKRDNLDAVERVQLQWEVDKSKAQLSHLKNRAELGAYKRNTVIIVLMLLMVILALIYNRQRLKANKDKALLASEKLRLDEELKNATAALHGYTENLTQKNLLIDEFKSELEKLKLRSVNEVDARELENMMKAHIMTDENWAEFRKLFSNVHPAFFYRLRNKFPHLTDTDIRLLTLLKLNLNNREMAGMLGITTDGVKKAKQRLRKKMALEAGQEIEDAIATL